MKLKSITNISNEIVRIEFKGGHSCKLHPQSTLENVDVIHGHKICSQVEIVPDLTEVVESTGKTRLLG